MISTSTGMTKAASTSAEPRSPRPPLRSRLPFVALHGSMAVASVGEELLKLRQGVEAQRCGGVRFHHRHQPRAPERIEEVRHLAPIARAMVIDLRRAEGIEPLVQRRQPAQPRPILVPV